MADVQDSLKELSEIGKDLGVIAARLQRVVEEIQRGVEARSGTRRGRATPAQMPDLLHLTEGDRVRAFVDQLRARVPTSFRTRDVERAIELARKTIAVYLKLAVKQNLLVRQGFGRYAFVPAASSTR